MELNRLNKILIIRLSSLGDILLTTPVIRSLKKRNPNLEIHFMLREQYSEILENNPHISKLIKLNKDYHPKSVAQELRSEEYDLIVDLQNNIRSHKINKALKIPAVRYNKPYLKRFALVHFKQNYYKSVMAIPERYAEAVSEDLLDDKGLELFIPNEFSTQLEEDNNYIAFCPGSRHYTKMWPIINYIELGKLLVKDRYKIVLLGGSDDIESCEIISSNIDDSINLCSDNNLFQTSADMQKCKLVICNDSGLMHIASALNVPLVSFFGSTVKEFGFSPYKCKNLVLENNSLSCRPCSHIGRNSCPKKHFNCMKEITPSIAYKNISEFITTL
ncbi:MAG: glycosyltransferase family 9 protein [Bacteroidetes bacterium]|nr:glycosyltransferase family 9 protein [Bacteroidota bacterium]